MSDNLWGRDCMAAHVERILEDFRVITLGIDRAVTMIGEADHKVESSMQAAARGGYLGVVARLQSAREGIGRVRGRLSTAHGAVRSATESMARASKEPSVAEIISVLIPASERVESIRNDLSSARAQLPDVIGQIAAAVNENPAIGILGTVGQQILMIVLERASVARQTIDAAIGDARRAQSGET
ncbi:MAG: hypothetical protein JXA67_13160 [Micromonosporaceae bacterium]|nr:hypothetical protein [Micromonosporaceae bacterium]